MPLRFRTPAPVLVSLKVPAEPFCILPAKVFAVALLTVKVEVLAKSPVSTMDVEEELLRLLSVTLRFTVLAEICNRPVPLRETLADAAGPNARSLLPRSVPASTEKEPA